MIGQNAAKPNLDRKGQSMNHTAEPKGPFRYRAYYWLCFASFVSILVGLANELNRAITGYDAFAFETALQTIIALPLAFLAIVMPVFLLAIPNWRDEYADSVWKRSVGVMAVAFTVTPPLVLVTAWVVYLIVGGDEPPPFLAWLGAEAMVWDVLIKSWYVFSAAYVVIFQIIQLWDRK